MYPRIPRACKCFVQFDKIRVLGTLQTSLGKTRNVQVSCSTCFINGYKDKGNDLCTLFILGLLINIDLKVISFLSLLSQCKCNYIVYFSCDLVKWPITCLWLILNEMLLRKSKSKCCSNITFIFSSVQLLSYVRLFVTPWITACQVSLSITNSRSSSSCPSSRWCHPAISSSVVPFSSCPQSLPASGSFPMTQLFTWGGQSIGVAASASVLPMNTQEWSPLG